MENLVISKTAKSPGIIIDTNRGTFEINGSSIMEDTELFYEPLMECVYEYIRNPKDTIVNIDLECLNTSSAKIMLIFFRTLSNIKKHGYKLTINWCFAKDDEDTRDAGYNFSSLVEVEFNFIERD